MKISRFLGWNFREQPKKEAGVYLIWNLIWGNNRWKAQNRNKTRNIFRFSVINLLLGYGRPIMLSKRDKEWNLLLPISRGQSCLSIGNFPKCIGHRALIVNLNNLFAIPSMQFVVSSRFWEPYDGVIGAIDGALEYQETWFSCLRGVYNSL